MPTSAKRRKQFVVVLKLPKNKAPLLITRARSIVQAVGGSSWFQSPSPSLAAVQTAIDALDLAQTATLTGTRGTASARDERRRELCMLLGHLAAYVEAIVAANPEHAESIVASASMYLRKAGGRTPQILSAEPGVSGQVKAYGPSARGRAIHEFEYSIDGGITWSDAGTDTKARTTIRNLKPGSTVHIRHRVIVKGVPRDWSASIAIIVG